MRQCQSNSVAALPNATRSPCHHTHRFDPSSPSFPSGQLSYHTVYDDGWPCRLLIDRQCSLQGIMIILTIIAFSPWVFWMVTLMNSSGVANTRPGGVPSFDWLNRSDDFLHMMLDPISIPLLINCGLGRFSIRTPSVTTDQTRLPSRSKINSMTIKRKWEISDSWRCRRCEMHHAFWFDYWSKRRWSRPLARGVININIDLDWSWMLVE